MKDLDKFVKTSSELAMKSTAAFFQKNGVDVKALDYDRLSAIAKRLVKQELNVAFKDANEALNAGMTTEATRTFTASMMQAGINTAKEYLKGARHG